MKDDVMTRIIPQPSDFILGAATSHRSSGEFVHARGIHIRSGASRREVARLRLESGLVS
jgi:hypothetical protein